MQKKLWTEKGTLKHKDSQSWDLIALAELQWKGRTANLTFTKLLHIMVILSTDVEHLRISNADKIMIASKLVEGVSTGR